MKVLKEISPSKRERDKVEKEIRDFIKEIQPLVKDAELVLGGSVAKDTWLSGSYDFDVFVRFDYDKYRDKDISKLLERRLKKGNKLHGSRDYFQIIKGKVTFELIPVLNIKNSRKAKNITDVSPLHTIWVNSHLEHKDQARLAKQFCKAHDIYGAESYIRGFSGYVLEVLISKYGTFFDLAKHASTWGKNVVVDVEKRYNSIEELMKKMNKSKISNLVVVDPVQPERNAAASLSEDKYLKFIELCKDFMRNPTEDFFVKSRFSLRDLRKELGEGVVFLLKVSPLIGKRDVIGSKLLKSYAYIKKKLEEKEFKIKKNGWKWEGKGSAYFWFNVDKELLPEYYRHYGPPIKENKHLEEFKRKWKDVQEEDGRVYVDVVRKYRNVRVYMKELVKEKYLHENVRRLVFKKVSWFR